MRFSSSCLWLLGARANDEYPSPIYPHVRLVNISQIHVFEFWAQFGHAGKERLGIYSSLGRLTGSWDATPSWGDSITGPSVLPSSPEGARGSSADFADSDGSESDSDGEAESDTDSEAEDAEAEASEEAEEEDWEPDSPNFFWSPGGRRPWKGEEMT